MAREGIDIDEALFRWPVWKLIGLLYVYALETCAGSEERYKDMRALLDWPEERTARSAEEQDRSARAAAAHLGQELDVEGWYAEHLERVRAAEAAQAAEEHAREGDPPLQQ